MITKETAREIYNCYQQIDIIEKTKLQMLEEIKRIREKKEREEPIPENDFGRFGKGMQLGIPDGYGSSMRVYNISPELGISVMDEQAKELKKRLKELGVIARLEMDAKKKNDNG